jgi:hypothetical protein
MKQPTPDSKAKQKTEARRKPETCIIIYDYRCKIINEKLANRVQQNVTPHNKFSPICYSCLIIPFKSKSFL